MQRVTIIAAFAALAALTATASAKAEDAASTNKPRPGVQVALEATLPLALGGEWTGGDAMPLGGPNPIDETKTEVVKYLLFLPSDESAKTDAGYPLLLFLHGAGERGDNIEAVKRHGPAKYCDDPEAAKTWRFITVSPQVKGNRFWSPQQLRVLLDQICDEYPVDRSRIYVTGLSMGGFGTWGMVAYNSDVVAAAAPLCGGYPLEFASKMTKTPIWAFHGNADGAVKYEYTRDLVNAVRDAGGKDVKFTTYPDAGHDIWTRTYANPALYDWFLTKKLNK